MIGKVRPYNRRLPEIIFSVGSKVIIAVLSIYIITHFVNFSVLTGVKEQAGKTLNKVSNAIVENVFVNIWSAFDYISDSEELYVTSFSQALNGAFCSFALIDVYSVYYSNLEYTAYDPNYEFVFSKDDVDEEDSDSDSEEKDDDNTSDAETVATTNTIVKMPELTGIQYSNEQLADFDFLLSNFYTVTSITTLKSSDIDAEEFMNMDLSIKGSNENPQILIYHTHSQEAFSDSVDGDTNTTIIGVGNYLTEILEEQFGYNVIHDTSTYDLVNGKLDRSSAYSQARSGVKKILEKNPTIEVVLDIHRDGVSDSTRLVTEINGKDTAQIMFFNGISRFKKSGDIDYLYNPYLSMNLALSLQMKLAAEAYYPGFTRKNYINAYKYNLDLCDKSMLIEVGAQTNTYQEAINAAEPLAVLLHKIIGNDDW